MAVLLAPPGADLFAQGADALANPVNCVGVMGAGLAKVFRTRFPQAYADYRARCARGEVRPGEPYWVRFPGEPCIVHVPTKRHWKDPSRLEDITAAVDFLAREGADWPIRRCAMPALGCGLGGLSFDAVRPVLLEGLAGLPWEVVVCPPR